MDKMLTTVDNPYSPFDQFDEWYAFDVSKGYNTCSYLARLSVTGSGLSDQENDDEIMDAMLEICNKNFYGVYRIVDKDTPITKK